MTLGEKLSRLRRENNYTQEQLADILKVSRQSISKWESDIAYPETDKLIKMGKLFDCSMDYLLNEEVIVLSKAKISPSGQTCCQRQKIGLFNPGSREEQANYVYYENTSFRRKLRKKGLRHGR